MIDVREAFALTATFIVSVVVLILADYGFAVAEVNISNFVRYLSN